MGAVGEVLFGGLFQGSLYALVAVGLALIWTTTGVFNFAHGVLLTLGAYVGWELAGEDGLGLPLALGLPLTLVALSGVGWLLQAIAVRPFIGRGENTVLVVCITTLAVASLGENGVLVAWGPRPKQMPPVATGLIDLAGISVSAHQLAIVSVTPVLLAAVWAFLNRTRLGLSLRAVAQNEDASLLVGLDVGRLYGLVFALAAMLAALAGVLLGGYRFMSPTMGGDPLLKALIVVVFGGISGIGGPILAAYLIGLFEAASAYLVGLYWTPALLFAVLILTLMVRPEGLFARRSRGLA